MEFHTLEGEIQKGDIQYRRKCREKEIERKI
jgi:hypothetical protein